jgi:hypothetical protein
MTGRQLAMFDAPAPPQGATWAVIWGRGKPLEETVKRAVTACYQETGRLPAALRCAAVELDAVRAALRALELHNLAQRVSGCAGILRGEVWISQGNGNGAGAR